VRSQGAGSRLRPDGLLVPVSQKPLQLIEPPRSGRIARTACAVWDESLLSGAARRWGDPSSAIRSAQHLLVPRKGLESTACAEAAGSSTPPEESNEWTPAC
jgi:hypothetical protein